MARVLILLVLAFAVVGCGSSDENPDAVKSQLAKEDADRTATTGGSTTGGGQFNRQADRN